MADHSNRSPSPLCSRPSNPSSINSENNSANRRSFSGKNNPFTKPSVLTSSRRFDPITPANSPSDFERKRSGGKEVTASYLKYFDEKENDEKDYVLKASKLQSPAKSCKNFMSPTISAASKFTSSPRKKVLVERNDPVRTSISLSNGKAMFFSAMSPNVSEDQLESKTEMSYHQDQKTERSLDSYVADSDKKKAVPEGHPVSKPSRRVSFSDVPSASHHVSESQSELAATDPDSLKLESVTTDSNSLKSDSNLKNTVASSSIAPLDADPSLIPYDPKTNYLSPRPQFLHYKPNPRIDILWNKDKGLDPEEFERLEDSSMAEIMSENFSDSDGTEESHREDWLKEAVEAIASADMVIGVDEKDANSHVSETSESLPVGTTVNDAISDEDCFQKSEKKPRAVFRLLCLSTILIFLIACVSISVMRSPLLDELVLKDLSFSDLSNFYHQSTASAKVNFDRFATHVNHLSVSSVSFFSKLANELGGGGGKQGPLQFMNLSDLQKNTWKIEVNELEEDLDTEMGTFDDELYADIDSDEKFEKGFDTEDDALVTETDTYGGEAYAEIDSDESIEKGFDTEDDALDTETDTYGEKAYAEIDSDESIEKEYDTQETVLINEAMMSPDSVKLVELESGDSEDVQSQREVISSIITTNQWHKQNSVDQSAAAPMDQEETEAEALVEVASDRAETEKSHADSNTGSSACPDATLSDYKTQTDVNPSEEVQNSTQGTSFVHQAVGVSSVFSALFAVAAFVYLYKRNPILFNVVQSDPLLINETGYGCTKHILQDREFSQNLPTEVDVIGGESGTSDMSTSFQKGPCSKKVVVNEVQSSERKTRKFSKRESLASSSEYSTGSPSFGSFTTYERIPFKHGDADEEIITPVRRSSRIRNHHQVTSP